MKPTMLIVDDVEMNREILKGIFEDDYHILEANDGEQLLERIQTEDTKIDILLLDLFMNGMTGFEVLEKRKKIEAISKVPVVVITGSDHTEDQIHAFQLGASEYICKPFDAEVVRFRVNRVMESKLLISKMETKVELDEMTGLYNKGTCERVINHILEDSEGQLNALLVVDIDHFKRVNDTYGHSAGDHVIQLLAEILQKSFRKSDVVGRIGGDEFVVLLNGIPDETVAKEKATFILSQIRNAPSLAIPDTVTVSVGMAFNDRHSSSYRELFQEADAALYHAKGNGRAQVSQHGEEPTVSPKPTVVNQALNGENHTVLVVDDSTVNRVIIRKLISEVYNVVEAEDGEQAISILENRDDIDVVLLDLIMPKMDGFTVLKTMPEIRKDTIPVIVLTGDLDRTSEEKALDLGAIDFIAKPIEPKILLSRLRNAIIRNQAVMLERLRKKSELDDLTGLPNRNTLFKNIHTMLETELDTTFAFVRFDIDKFRLYNSAMGETQGDALLRRIADLLPKIANAYPICQYGRVDADVFCICMPYDHAKLIQQSEMAQEEINHYREDYLLSVSFGVYIIQNPSESVESIYTKASMAADLCKNAFDRNIAFFEKSMGEKAREELEISNKMNNALETHQFLVYLQPKYDLLSEHPCGAEALVRWKDPMEGLIPPGKFIGIFERNGFISKLDYYMWEEVCKLLAKWKEAGDPVYPVSVNISRVSMYNPHLPAIIHHLVEKYDVDPKLLQLEITESAYMSNPDLMKETIQRFHERGFSILMDDFGSGYSSLNTLKEIDVDILKIDMNFMPESMKDQKSAKILSSVVRMAGWIGMSVVAEGVETKEQKDYLESIGCGYVQGFYYAKPMCVEEYETLIRKSASGHPDTTILRPKVVDFAWAPTKEMDDLMRVIPLPMAIYEVGDQDMEIIRANQSYMTLFNLWKHTETMQALGEEAYYILKDTLNRSSREDRKVSCEFRYATPNQGVRWYQLNAMRIGSIPKTSIVCGMFVDITDEKLYENQLAKIEKLFGSKTRRKLLIIDDQEVSRTLLRGMFEGPYEILEANDGDEGLQILEAEKDQLAIILLDMVMPRLDGEGFLKQKNQKPDCAAIPVIIISSEEATDTQIRMLQLGVNDYITKPFDPTIVKERIQSVIAYNSRFQSLLQEYRNDR